MRKLIVPMILLIVICILCAGCVQTTEPVKKVEEFHEHLTDDRIVGNWISVDDMQGQITNMAGQKCLIQIYPDYTYKEHWFTYVEGLDYLSTTEGTWKPLTSTESETVKVTKPASLGDDKIFTEVDKSDYQYELDYKWATEPFMHLFKFDTERQNFIINHDGKQFRKIDDISEYEKLII